MNHEMKRQAALRDAITEEIRHLLDANLPLAEQAAAEADRNGDSPVKCSLSIAVSFPAGAPRPEVSVKIKYGKPITDESTITVDPDQLKLPLEES